jgi:protein-tyrosine phosphatase
MNPFYKVFVLALVGFIPYLSFSQLADSATRLVRMQGAVNFRDAGGYKTTDGREVVRGKVFRSADISKLTDLDLQMLAEKHIHTVIDFRGIKESAAAPDRLLPGTDYTLSPAGSDNLPDMKRIAALIKQGGFLQKMYGDSSIQYYGQRYKPLFQKLLLLPDTAALLYHCTGGRDRTGMASALFLYALGVPQETIEQDFTASNVYLQSMHSHLYNTMAQGFGISLEEVKKEMELRPELIQSFFHAITKQYGSVENFMSQELGLGKKERATLRKKYTW